MTQVDSASPLFAEEDLLPLSGLQHLVFCERRAALVHLEQLWDENVFTAEGAQMHKRAHDEAQSELRGTILITRGLRLRSLTLGLSGKADVVEFHRVNPNEGVTLPDRDGWWQPVPIEYKHGRYRREEGYLIQICAQAQCLEEMLNCTISSGYLYFGQNRRRMDIAFDEALRAATVNAARRMHELFAASVTPPGVYEKKCKSCSLLEICRPQKIQPSHSAAGFLSRHLDEVEQEDHETPA